ncbi:MAG: hypothetical protein ACP5MZ_03755 [Candidatus Micrarchaeia archaeon]
MHLKYVAISIFLLFSLVSLSYAQLGEQAGQPTMNISVGSSGTFNYSIINSGATPIPFKVIPPVLNTIPHNATPIVVVTPSNGTLAPGSTQIISIKVSIPSSDKANLKWQGIVQVVEAAPTKIQSSGEGALITAGVAKILTIYSTPPKPIPLIYYIIAIVVVAIAVGVGASVVIIKRSRKVHAKMASRASGAAIAVKRARSTSSKRKPSAASKRARKPAAKKGKAGKKSASKSKRPARARSSPASVPRKRSARPK